MLVALATHNGDRHLSAQLAQHIRNIGGVRDHELLLVAPLGTNLVGVEEVFRDAFVRVRVHYYAESMRGWPWGANEAAHAVFLEVFSNPELPGYFLMLEPDCVPVGQHWLGYIDMEYRRCGMPVMGVTIPTHELNGQPTGGRHTVGVAVYPKDFPRHCGLFKNVLDMTRAHQHANHLAPWDVIFGPYVAKMTAQTGLIQHLYRRFTHDQHGARWDVPSIDEALAQVRPGVVLIHGCKQPEFLNRITGGTPNATSQRQIENRTEYPRNASGAEVRASAPEIRSGDRQTHGNCRRHIGEQEEKLNDWKRGRLASGLPLGMSESIVFGIADNLKIFNAIISSIPVKVMNMLGGNKISAEMLRDNPAMFAHLLSINGDENISSLVRDALKSEVARARTVLFNAYKAGHDVEFLPAIRASDLDICEVVGLLSPDLGKTLGDDLGIGDVTTESCATPGAKSGSMAFAWSNGVFLPAVLANLGNWHSDIIKKSCLSSSNDSGGAHKNLTKAQITEQKRKERAEKKRRANHENFRKEFGIEFPIDTPEFTRALDICISIGQSFAGKTTTWADTKAYGRELGLTIPPKWNKGILSCEITKAEKAQHKTEKWKVQPVYAPAPPPPMPELAIDPNFKVESHSSSRPAMETMTLIPNGQGTAGQIIPAGAPKPGPMIPPAIGMTPERMQQMRQMIANRRAQGMPA